MTTATFEPRHSIRLKPGRDASVRARHPWIFSGAVAEVASLPDAQDGDVCDVRSDAGEWLARGTLHRSSQILCRILTWREEPIDTAFFLGRFAEAARLRAEMADLEGTDAFRVVNAEGDRLPGLIVDRYGEHLVVQALTTGMLRLQPAWLAALEESFAPASVVDRTEGAVRDPAMYGRRAVLSGDPPPDGMLSIREAGIRFRVSLLSGQKTGFYLDQRPNRLRLGQLARGREVLNAFAYTGAFGIHAARGGAKRVVQVESSAPALAEARANAEANGIPEEQVAYVQDDVGRYLRSDAAGEFDAIVLDPPPYAKDRGSVDRAARAYKDVNLRAMRRLRPGGILMSFSCSQHVGIDLLQKILFGAARDAGASMQWLARLGPGADHPVHLDHPQGEYLKGFLLRRIG